jgi:hypothetical protein
VIFLPLFKPVLGSINQKEALRYAGMRQGAELPEAVVRAALAEALLYAEPGGAWEIYGYQAPRLQTAGGGYVPGSQKLCAHLGGAVRVAVLAVSVGGKLEARVAELFAAGEYAKAVLLDAAATAAVEQAADSVCAFIAAAAQKEGLCAGQRFSPGYGDWDIKEQPEVLRLAGAEQIGIGLTSSFMLLPRKSVTAMLGLKPAPGSGELPAGCVACAKADCQLRRRDTPC